MLNFILRRKCFQVEGLGGLRYGAVFWWVAHFMNSKYFGPNWTLGTGTYDLSLGLIRNKDSGFLNRFSRRKQSLQANCIAELQINEWALQLIIARYQS